MKYLLMTLVLLMVAGSAVADRLIIRLDDPPYDTLTGDDCINSSIEDTWYFNGETTFRENESTGRSWGIGSTVYGTVLIRLRGLADTLGADVTVESCSLAVYCESGDEGEAVAAYRVLKPWAEGAPGDDYNSPDLDSASSAQNWLEFITGDGSSYAIDSTYAWTTHTSLFGDDGGTDNTGDGVGADRKATPEATVNIAVNAYNYFDITALAQGWYDGSYAENGVQLFPINYEYHLFTLSNSSVVNQRPFFVINYSADAAPPPTGTIRGAHLRGVHVR